MRARLSERRLEWTAITEPTADEQAVLRRYMDAYERSDVAALVALLREDARQTMPPAPLWFDGRVALAAFNRQPAAACYLRRHGESEFRLDGLDVLRIEDGGIAEITTFTPELLPAFGLPPTLDR